MTDQFTSSTGHTWPCTGFYVTSSEADRTHGCTCGHVPNHLEAARDAFAEAAENARKTIDPEFTVTTASEIWDAGITLALPHLRAHLRHDRELRHLVIQDLVDELDADADRTANLGPLYASTAADLRIVIGLVEGKLLKLRKELK